MISVDLPRLPSASSPDWDHCVRLDWKRGFHNVCRQQSSLDGRDTPRPAPLNVANAGLALPPPRHG